MKWSPLQKRWLLGAVICSLLAILSAFLLDALLSRWVTTTAVVSSERQISERSLRTFDVAEGTIHVASIFPHDSSIGLPAGQLLRVFESAAQKVPNVELLIDYVDPLVDISKANGLIKKANEKASVLKEEGEGVLFYQSERSVFLSAKDLCGEDNTFDPNIAEEAFATAIMRLFRAEIRVGWLINHKEPDFESVDVEGYSQFKNALRREGFSLEPIVLDTSVRGKEIPSEIGVLMVVAPLYELSQEEQMALYEWVQRGGRLFCSLPANGDGGLRSLLEHWGVQVGTAPINPTRMSTGGVGLTDIFSTTHEITRLFSANVTATFVAPYPLYLSQKEGMKSTTLVDMMNQQSLVTKEQQSIMAAVELGERLGDDLGIRPGRVVVVGGSSFFSNRFTKNHATANQDLIVNAVRWLAGVSGNTAYGAPTNRLSIGQDNREWFRDSIVLIFVFPSCFVLLAWLLFRRHS